MIGLILEHCVGIFMTSSKKIIEEEWLPDWAYGSNEKERIKQKSFYWTDDIYATEKKSY